MQQQVDKKHYTFGKYAHLERFGSYFYQLREVLQLSPSSILEVGVGDKVFASFIQNNTDILYKSIDIAADLHPDIVGSVDNMPLENDTYDLVCAFEILEHLPFDHFEQSLIQIARVSRKHAVISLPHYGPSLKLLFKLPFLKEMKGAFKLPHHPEHRFNGEHYWEIGKKGYPLEKVLSLMGKYFIVQKHFVPFENQYHHFFVLEKLSTEALRINLPEAGRVRSGALEAESV